MATEVPEKTRGGDKKEENVDEEGFDKISNWMQDNFTTPREVLIKYINEYQAFLNGLVSLFDQV